jgi:hypothetical protein
MIELLSGMYTEAPEGHIGWFEDRQQKLKEIITTLYPINLIEIGFHMGHSCKLICDTIVGLKENDVDYMNKDVNFYVFDINYHQFIESNLNILREYYKNKNIELIFIKGASQITVEPFMRNRDRIFDFIEIDGLHTADGTYKDIMDTYIKIRKGGVLYVDDYSEIPNSGSEINKAIERVIWNGYDICHIEGIFWGIKK